MNKPEILVVHRRARVTKRTVTGRTSGHWQLRGGAAETMRRRTLGGGRQPTVTVTVAEPQAPTSEQTP